MNIFNKIKGLFKESDAKLAHRILLGKTCEGCTHYRLRVNATCTHTGMIMDNGRIKYVSCGPLGGNKSGYSKIKDPVTYSCSAWTDREIDMNALGYLSGIITYK